MGRPVSVLTQRSHGQEGHCLCEFKEQLDLSINGWGVWGTFLWLLIPRAGKKIPSSCRVLDLSVLQHIFGAITRGGEKDFERSPGRKH